MLLSDVAGSRKIKERRKFEKKLADALQKIGQQYSNVFETPIQVWKGLDETAAVVKQPWLLYEVMDAIDSALAPHKMRFVLVKAMIDIMPPNGDIARADGPAFHLAAAQMLELKKEGLKFSCSTGNPVLDKAWKGQVNLLWLLKSGWTERQRTVYKSYCRAGLQEQVASKLKITQQSVSKTLKSIAAAQVQALEQNLLAWTEAQLKR